VVEGRSPTLSLREQIREQRIVEALAEEKAGASNVATSNSAESASASNDAPKPKRGSRREQPGGKHELAC
jgi:hypothetical protein